MADFKSKYISELEKGKGLIGGAKGAASSSMDDFKKQFSKESIAKKAFGGDDILSALIRGKLGIKTGSFRTKRTITTYRCECCQCSKDKQHKSCKQSNKNS